MQTQCSTHAVAVTTLQAANAGGVAVSGLEMAQNSARLSWSSEEVDGKLKVRSLPLHPCSPGTTAISCVIQC